MVKVRDGSAWLGAVPRPAVWGGSFPPTDMDAKRVTHRGKENHFKLAVRDWLAAPRHWLPSCKERKSKRVCDLPWLSGYLPGSLSGGVGVRESLGLARLCDELWPMGRR